MRFIQLATLFIAITFALTFFSGKASAQESVTPEGQAISFHIGSLLPRGVEATSEMLSASGFRYAFPAFTSSLLEIGYTGSNSAGVAYSDIDLGIRKDLSFQDLFVFGTLGLDLTRISGPNAPNTKYFGGIHMGGGVLAHIVESLYLRGEMRFIFGPGTILFFGLGLELRF